MSNKVIEVSNLYFKYHDNYVIDNLNCSIEEGKFVAIIGENGSGKSTLLNLILQNLKAEKGTIKLFGDDIEENNHYDDIAFISQNSVLNYKNFPTTIEEVIKIHLKYLKKDKKDLTKYLKLIGLESHAKKSLSELSGGQLQRVGLVLALIKDAKLILLDEPTTGIDKKFIHELFNLLKELSRKNRTIVMVTHELEEARMYVDNVLHMKHGRNHECEALEWKDLMRL